MIYKFQAAGLKLNNLYSLNSPDLIESLNAFKNLSLQSVNEYCRCFKLNFNLS